MDNPYIALHPIPSQKQSDNRRRRILLAAVVVALVFAIVGTNNYAPDTANKVKNMVVWTGNDAGAVAGTKPHRLSKVVCFGDSLSDDGCVSSWSRLPAITDISLVPRRTGAWKVTKGTWPNRDAVSRKDIFYGSEAEDRTYLLCQYAGHRFSNGPVYTEYMAQDLLLPLDSLGKAFSWKANYCTGH